MWNHWPPKSKNIAICENCLKFYKTLLNFSDICLDNETFADVLSTINGDETEQQEWPEMYKPTISQEIASYVHYELEGILILPTTLVNDV